MLASKTDVARPVAIAPHRLCVLEDDLKNIASVIGARDQHAKAFGRRAYSLFLNARIAAQAFRFCAQFWHLVYRAKALRNFRRDPASLVRGAVPTKAPLGFSRK